MCAGREEKDMKEDKLLLYDKENRISESKSKGVAEQHMLFTKTHGKIPHIFSSHWLKYRTFTDAGLKLCQSTLNTFSEV